MEVKISKKDIIWNYIGTVFTMGINYLMLPIYLLFFDDDTLGIWYIFMNMATIGNLFTFGFSQSFARNIAYCWGGAKELKDKGKAHSAYDAQKQGINVDLFCRILNVCKKIYMVIAIGTFLIMVSLGSIYIVTVIPYRNYTFIVAWAIFLCAIFLNLYFGYCEAFLNGVGAIALRNKAQVISNIFRIILTALLLMSGIGIIGACLAYLCYGVIFRVIGLSFFRRTLKKANILTRSTDEYSKGSSYELLKTIWPNTWRTGVVTVASYLTSYAGTILISFFVPLSIVGNYSLSVQLVIAVEKIAYSYTGSCHPMLQVDYIKGEKDKLKKSSIKCILVFFIIYILGVVLLLAIGAPILHIFKKDFELNTLLIIGIAISEFIIGFRNEFTAILSTMNNVDCWKAFIISGVIAVLLGGFLMHLGYGIAGLIVSTIVIELSYNFWHWPKKLFDEIKVMGETNRE